MNTRNIIISLCFSSIVMAENSRPPEVQSQETQQVLMWEEKLAASHMLEPEEKIKALWLGLRNMGWRRSFAGHGEQVEVIYRKLQEELLATPGHARYLTALLNEARKDTNQPWYDRSYSDKFDRIKETLAHLPSPESVWEMGKFLEDPSDIITGEMLYERKAMNDPTLVHWHLGANPRSLATEFSMKSACVGMAMEP